MNYFFTARKAAGIEPPTGGVFPSAGWLPKPVGKGCASLTGHFIDLPRTLGADAT